MAATDATLQGIEQALDAGTLFWLDLDVHDPGPDEDVNGLLIDAFHLHAAHGDERGARAEAVTPAG